VFDTLSGLVTELVQSPDTTMPTTSRYFKQPLYKLTRPDEESNWSVACDLRPGLIQVPLYV
jgi:hypothetical protein